MRYNSTHLSTEDLCVSHTLSKLQTNTQHKQDLHYINDLESNTLLIYTLFSRELLYWQDQFYNTLKYKCSLLVGIFLLVKNTSMFLIKYYVFIDSQSSQYFNKKTQ